MQVRERDSHLLAHSFNPFVNPPVSSSKTSTSVKVPPTSTATLYGISLLSRKGFRHQVTGIRFLVGGDAVDRSHHALQVVSPGGSCRSSFPVRVRRAT